MNFYVCSTVRHLLFAILKSLSEPNVSNKIFMITDQQNIDPEQYQPNALPQNIEVIFFQRKLLRKTLYKGFIGNLLKLSANFNVITNQSIRNLVKERLFTNAFNLTISNTEIKHANLFLFNDRNKISRLFRLAFEEYNLLEEGLGNYRTFQAKKIDIAISLLKFQYKSRRYFGDDDRCKKIYLLDKNKVNKLIKPKVENIDFITESAIKSFCLPFFNAKNHDFSFILATQPLAKTQIDMAVYKIVIEKITNQGFPIIIKPHPSEDISRYKSDFPNVPIIDGKIPLELLTLGTQNKSNIISLYSTAGMGFEKYCVRTMLIHDNELNDKEELYTKWRKDKNLIMERVDDMIVLPHS